MKQVVEETLSRDCLLDVLRFDIIKGRRSAALYESPEVVNFREWCLQDRGLVARVGNEIATSQHFLSVKMTLGWKLAMEFEQGRIPKENLLLISGVKDTFYKDRAASKDGSLGYDRKGLLILDFDKPLPGYTFAEMKRELTTFLHYPVCSSPSGAIKVFAPISIRACSPWNYDTRMATIAVFLNTYLPKGMAESYWDVLDKEPAASRVFYACKDILKTIFEFETLIHPLILIPSSEIQDSHLKKAQKDRKDWMVTKDSEELTSYVMEKIFFNAPPDKRVSERLLESKTEALQQDPKFEKWIEKYLLSMKERMGKLTQSVNLSEEQKVRARVYGCSFFTKLSDYLLILRIMLSQPNINDQRSIKFFQEVLVSNGVDFKITYIHALFKELEKMGLILKTISAQRGLTANHYQLMGKLEEIYWKSKKDLEIRKALDLPRDIQEGEWYPEMWKQCSKFRHFEEMQAWVESLPSFTYKKGQSRTTTAKRRLRMAVGAWNSSIKKDMENGRLRSRDAALAKLVQDEVVKIPLMV